MKEKSKIFLLLGIMLTLGIVVKINYKETYQASETMDEAIERRTICYTISYSPDTFSFNGETFKIKNSWIESNSCVKSFFMFKKNVIDTNSLTYENIQFYYNANIGKDLNPCNLSLLHFRSSSNQFFFPLLTRPSIQDSLILQLWMYSVDLRNIINDHDSLFVIKNVTQNRTDTIAKLAKKYTYVNKTAIASYKP